MERDELPDPLVFEERGHAWIVVFVADNFPGHSNKPGEVYRPQVLWCDHCGLVRDGLYADPDGAYYAYTEFERWAHRDQPECKSQFNPGERVLVYADNQPGTIEAWNERYEAWDIMLDTGQRTVTSSGNIERAP